MLLRIALDLREGKRLDVVSFRPQIGRNRRRQRGAAADTGKCGLRGRTRGRALPDGLAFLPIAIPGLVLGVALLMPLAWGALCFLLFRFGPQLLPVPPVGGVPVKLWLWLVGLACLIPLWRSVLAGEKRACIA